jgi:hypothetical protein
MSAATLTRDLVVTHTRALKLPGVARVFESLARQARDAHWPHEDYLQEVLSAEQASRHESVIRQRLREAHFSEVKTLDTFDFAAVEGISATQIHTLARGEWVAAPENLIFARPHWHGENAPRDRARRRSDEAETTRALYPRGRSRPPAARSP